MLATKKQKQKLSKVRQPSSSSDIGKFLTKPSQSTLVTTVEPKSELPKYRYFNNIMRNLEEVKISWGLSSKLNQLRTGRIRAKISELLQVIKK